MRRLRPEDSMEALTALLHEAYAPLAAANMHYFASHQTPEDTRRRALRGECWLALDGARLVGTVTIYTAKRASGCPTYDEPDVGSFGQFAVAPDWQGRGLGAALMDLAESRVRADGAAWMACDTAMPANHLVRLYEGRGFSRVTTTQWDKVNYRSHVLRKPLRETPRLIARSEGVTALFKPAGLPVHGERSLLTWAARYGYADLAPIHRLDAGTSGVVLCAADPKVRAEVSAHFAEGAVQKSYLTLVQGKPNKKGIIRRALRDARRKRNLAAVSRYRTLERHKRTALLRVRPETGRKHQIRRHLAGIGLPVIGDERYGKGARVPAFPGRLWLHAERIELPDGRAFSAALAWELADHLVALRQGSAP